MLRPEVFHPPSSHVWAWRVGGWLTMLGGLLIVAQGLFVVLLIVATMAAPQRGEFDELGWFFGGIAAALLLGVGLPLFLAGWFRSWGAFPVLLLVSLIGAFGVFFFGGPQHLDPGALTFLLVVQGGPLALAWAGAVVYSAARIAAASARSR